MTAPSQSQNSLHQRIRELLADSFKNEGFGDVAVSEVNVRSPDGVDRIYEVSISGPSLDDPARRWRDSASFVLSELLLTRMTRGSVSMLEIMAERLLRIIRSHMETPE